MFTGVGAVLEAGALIDGSIWGAATVATGMISTASDAVGCFGEKSGAACVGMAAGFAGVVAAPLADLGATLAGATPEVSAGAAAMGYAVAGGGVAWDGANDLPSVNATPSNGSGVYASLNADANASGNPGLFRQQLEELNAAANASGNRAAFLHGLKVCAAAGGC